MKRRTRRLTAAQALIEFLQIQHVERDGAATPFFGPVMGILGHGNVGGIGEALEAAQDRVRFITARNEQAMVHTAAAYAWRRRRLGALACTTSVGPGATNMVTGAAGATINRLPVLLLPGDVFAARHVRPLLQQLETPGSQLATVNDTFRPVSRFWDRIERPEQLLASLPEAMRVLTSPAETGAVTICLPQDTQAEAFDWPEQFLEPRTWRVARPEAEPALIAELAGLLRKADQPLLVCGGGVRYSEAEEELGDLAELYGVPVVETQAGKGSLRWDHPLNLGPIGSTGGLAANRWAREADLVIALGTRLGDFTTASGTVWQRPDARLVAVNVGEADAGKARLSIVADARQALRALRRELGEPSAEERTGRLAERRRRVDALRDEWQVEVDRLRTMVGNDGLLSQAQLIARVNEAAQGSGTVINAAGSMPGDLHKLWRAGSPDDYHVEYGYSCMGYEIAGGLGVKLADPERHVIVLVGDGSYLMMNSEIVTSLQEHAPLTIVVVDSHGYASIGSLARSMGARNGFNDLVARDPRSGRLEGDVLRVDFAAHAASMGAHATRVRTADELDAALAKARGAEHTSVVVAEVDPSLRVPGYESWWEVPVAEVSGSEAVRSARAEYERARERQRTLS
ncbi:MAG TPA: 3D-(3,5/4)-trihydroxycyclohexane-1,2-dione acylhydrolase (decyclizing) [Candidatus Limnocylindrales bacterium]|nr:3D-(3,5/4)-trihydroxycyclohexane-1,2-dione acylhydrolase (decyclizing) [Candidatus Limnocylindrales bacterium]